MKLQLAPARLLSALIPILTITPAACAHSVIISRIWPPSDLNPVSNRSPARIPVVIWHGLSDSYANPGLDRLAQKIDLRYPGTTVYKIRLADSDAQDRRATWFGSANEQVASVCDQLSQIDELSLGFDAIGLSQGGQLMRAYTQRCNRPKVRNLITLGSQHMGVSGTAPCTSLFDLGCHVLHKLIESGTVYGPYAQQNVIPAQYFRDQSNLAPYMKHNEFLRDINNERWNDTQPADSGSLPIGEPEDGVKYQPRNETYKQNFQSLESFVMFRFTADTLVIPPTSAYFTIPNATESTLPDILDPIPIALQDLPIYQEDYIGLKVLDEAGKIHYGTCFGAHMQIDEDCWENVMDWLGDQSRSEANLLLQTGPQNQQLVLQHD
ncbi:hypothetical protein PtA15_16A420 [Puccinia triticina]|uniref:Palmitoyl-protein thioesterase 1 n=1 Tax=Puccinia triticina TaxID=208348 RepID=A0ABY7D766_9BASI|nr:uncharacterized protein PtA15_16A420 [Puccinia triticina]WAQ92512.1 hypothetical protein PtA15_16A420 [Puccinia triticina]